VTLFALLGIHLAGIDGHADHGVHAQSIQLFALGSAGDAAGDDKLARGRASQIAHHVEGNACGKVDCRGASGWSVLTVSVSADPRSQQLAPYAVVIFDNN